MISIVKNKKSIVLGALSMIFTGCAQEVTKSNMRDWTFNYDRDSFKSSSGGGKEFSGGRDTSGCTEKTTKINIGVYERVVKETTPCDKPDCPSKNK